MNGVPRRIANGGRTPSDVGDASFEHRPYCSAYWRIHNPLLAMSDLALETLLFPVIWLAHLAYLSCDFWQYQPGSNFLLEVIANVHLLAAYATTAFILVHVYL